MNQQIWFRVTSVHQNYRFRSLSLSIDRTFRKQRHRQPPSLKQELRLFGAQLCILVSLSFNLSARFIKSLSDRDSAARLSEPICYLIEKAVLSFFRAYRYLFTSCFLGFLQDGLGLIRILDRDSLICLLLMADLRITRRSPVLLVEYNQPAWRTLSFIQL